MSAACGKMVHFKITKSKQTWYLKYVVQKQKKKIENINEIKTKKSLSSYQWAKSCKINYGKL